MKQVVSGTSARNACEWSLRREVKDRGGSWYARNEVNIVLNMKFVLFENNVYSIGNKILFIKTTKYIFSVYLFENKVHVFLKQRSYIFKTKIIYFENKDHIF